ncbi:MAG: hypothetical protein AAF371_18695 [Pseudomonadota bacterium]
MLTPATILAPMGVAGARALAWRNLALDAAFYDLPGLTPAELEALSHVRHEEGTVIVVDPPDGSREVMGAGPKASGCAAGLRSFANYEALRAAPGRLVSQVVVAGVGSSGLGAAALARTVAAVTERPTAAVVAGYGAEDFVSEALGGFFLFGAANRARHARQTLRHRVGTMIAESPNAPAVPKPLPHQFATPDVATLVRLLSDTDRRVDLLLGHSKGALAIAAALARVMRTADPVTRAKAARAQVVSAGAVIAFPPEVQWVTQLLGALDGLGALNSRLGLPHRRVAMAGHHLNTALPFHLDLARELRAVLNL